jgi:hypothetical protein
MHSQASRYFRSRQPVNALLVALVATVFVVSAATASPPPPTGSSAVDPSEDRFMRCIHLTDLHISLGNPTRASSAKALLSSLILRFAPHCIIVSGDLVDGKHPDGSSEQIAGEWEAYADLRASVPPGIEWMHVRGNHDSFNVPYASTSRHPKRAPAPPLLSKSNNVDAASSAAAPTPSSHPPHSNEHAPTPPSSAAPLQCATPDPASRIIQCITKPSPSLVPVSFILIDAAPHPGPARPLNFFGSLTSRDMDEVFFALHRGQRAGGVRFVVSHYPTALISSSGPSRDRSATLRSLLVHSKNVMSFVLCGHLHDLDGLAPRLHTSHSPNVMELLLADWKIMRKCVGSIFLHLDLLHVVCYAAFLTCVSRFRLIVVDRLYGTLAFDDFAVEQEAHPAPHWFMRLLSGPVPSVNSGQHELQNETAASADASLHAVIVSPVSAYRPQGLAPPPLSSPIIIVVSSSEPISATEISAAGALDIPLSLRARSHMRHCRSLAASRQLFLFPQAPGVLSLTAKRPAVS